MPPLPRQRDPRRSRVAALLVAAAAVVTLPMADAPKFRTPERERFVIEALDHVALATLEDPEGRALVVPRAWLPTHAREGDVLRSALSRRRATARVLFDVDATATAERSRALRDRHDRLPRGPSGNMEP